MRKVETIIDELKNQIYWSQPNIKFAELMSLVTELENTLFPSEVITEEPVVEVIEEPVVEEVIEETIIEETVVEEVTEEPVVAKKSTKKK